jgi:hypothetical protein
MPFAEFQPSAAGAQLNEHILRNIDFGASLMERAARHQALLQDVEQRKQRFVRETLLTDQQIQENRRRLAEWEGEAAYRAARTRTGVAELDARKANAVANERTLEAAATALPGTLQRMQAESDPEAIENLAADFHDRYGHLENLPEYSGRLAPFTAQVGAVLRSRRTAFAARVRTAAETLSREVDPANPEMLDRIRQSPFFSIARRDPDFAARYDIAQAAAAARTPSVAPGSGTVETFPSAPVSPAQPALPGSAVQEILRRRRLDWSKVPFAPPEPWGNNPMS